jgi:hypothetical protein
VGAQCWFDTKKAEHKQFGMRFGDRFQEAEVQIGDFPSVSVWEPPTALQRVLLHTDDQGEEAVLYFPLELTNKDYQRRTLEVIARGVRDKILRITRDEKLHPVAQNNDGDIQYLLKQVLGRNFARSQDGDVDKEREGQHIRQIFSDELRCPLDKLRESAQFIFDQRNMLFHLESDVSNNVQTLNLFGAARQFLECFGACASSALECVSALKTQYMRHQEFREKRLRDLGWTVSGQNGQRSEDVPVLSDKPAPDAADVLHSCAVVIARLGKALGPQQLAHIKALNLLELMGGEVMRLEEEAAKKSAYTEAASLKALAFEIAAALDASYSYTASGWPASCATSGKEHLLEASKLVARAEGVIASLSVAEARARSDRNYTGSNSAAAIGEQTAKLMTRKDELKQLLAKKHVILPEAEPLTGRSLWFACQSDHSSIASLVYAASCPPFAEIASDQGWLDRTSPRRYPTTSQTAVHSSDATHPPPAARVPEPPVARSNTAATRPVAVSATGSTQPTLTPNPPALLAADRSGSTRSNSALPPPAAKPSAGQAAGHRFDGMSPSAGSRYVPPSMRDMDIGMYIGTDVDRAFRWGGAWLGRVPGKGSQRRRRHVSPTTESPTTECWV